MSARTFPTKRIRPLSKTKSNGRVISPTKELRALKVGRFFTVDDAASRRRVINAAHRLDIRITTREEGGKFQIHRLDKEPAPLLEYPIA
jgi:hypothetical protein